MAEIKGVIIPDIGTADEVDVIDILVKPGDTVTAEQAILTLESEKASMDIPAPFSGTVKDVNINVGDKVTAGMSVMLFTVEAEPILVPIPSSTYAVKNGEATVGATINHQPVAEVTAPFVEPVAASTQEALVQVTVPDLGGVDKVDVIEVAVKAGDVIAKDDALITLESEKASMDVPSPVAGRVNSVEVKVGDKVTPGGLIALVRAEETTTPEAAKEVAQPAAAVSTPIPTPAPTVSTSTKQEMVSEDAVKDSTYASPSVRRLARELNVNLASISGTGRKGRVTRDDLQTYIKSAMQTGTGSTTASAPAPMVDFSQFGETETRTLSKIKKLTARNLHRNWNAIPHVTQFDEADITEMEAYRKANKAKAEAQGNKLTPLVFIMKAVVACLKEMPIFNSSLAPDGQSLIEKQYYHIGVAVDTPDGLVVPVVRDVDQKGFLQLAQELGEISAKARKKQLMPKDMQGSCFTISSLGGIGGTAFTPIINAPDVAILGVSKAAIKPVLVDNEFVPRLMLPLSLSYDHRVVDGADAARFTRYLGGILEDIRTLLL